MRLLIILTLVTGLSGCSRPDTITRFAEENPMEKQFYVYPSTLRMANLEQKEDFNELIEDFVKGQYFVFLNNTENARLIAELKADLTEEGFEEVMTYRNKDRDGVVYIQERKVPRLAAILETDSTFNIVQVQGLVNIAKIPKLIQEFDESDYLNVLDVINFNPNQHEGGPHSQD